MKRKFVLILSAVPSLGALGLLAEAGMGSTNSKAAAIEKRLAQALKLYPDADLDKDGTLSINEGLAYLEKHPELRQKLLQATSRSGGSATSKPASYGANDTGERVFVCGHSYMIFTAGMLPAVSKFADIPYRSAGQQMIGGSQVIQHWEVPDAKNEAKKSLREGAVDVLLLSPNALIPDEGIDHFTKLGLEHNPALRVLVQASWAPRDGKLDAEFKNSQRDAATVAELEAMRAFQHEGWLKQLEQQVSSLNSSLGKGRQVVNVVPVFDAVYVLREKIIEGKAPGLKKQSELFKDDHGHPSPPLALLVTYCHFAAIHQKSPVGLRVPDSIKGFPQAEAMNKMLQELAWETVSRYPQSGVNKEVTTL